MVLSLVVKDLSTYIKYYIYYSCMTKEMKSKEKIDDQREESPYKCSMCDRAFQDRAEFERHQGNAHKEEQSI